MIAWKKDTRCMGVLWQSCDILQTVTHRNVCGYRRGAGDCHRRSGLDARVASAGAELSLEHKPQKFPDVQSRRERRRN